jgi:hypothetical protein
MYLYAKWRGNVGGIQASKPGPPDVAIDENDCDGPSLRAMVVDKNGVLTQLCQDRDTQKTMTIITFAVMVPLTAVTGYFAYFHHKREAQPKRMALTPVVTTQSAGAMFQMTW